MRWAHTGSVYDRPIVPRDGYYWVAIPHTGCQIWHCKAGEKLDMHATYWCPVPITEPLGHVGEVVKAHSITDCECPVCGGCAATIWYLGISEAVGATDYEISDCPCGAMLSTEYAF